MSDLLVPLPKSNTNKKFQKIRFESLSFKNLINILNEIYFLDLIGHFNNKNIIYIQLLNFHDCL